MRNTSDAVHGAQCAETRSTLIPLQEVGDRGISYHANDFPKESFKIVVVDDSPVYRKLVEGVLAQERYAVSFAKNGHEALKALTEQRPALVITDWEMPDISGLELCQKIRDEHESYTYVILLTGNSEKDRVIEGLAAGADDYLTKPFHSGELLARVAVGRRMVELHWQVREKNRQLRELALTDSLTGLPNRRALEEWGRRALNGAARHRYPFWIVLADLDHFKLVNDNYGHESGDVVLKKFADLFRRHTRSSNICGRIGGEEFVTVLTHVDEAGVQIAMERFRQQLQEEQFPHDGNVIRMTASFGIAGFQGERAPTFEELLRNADAALYEAKRKGRNRLEFAP
jgi:two-component system cell cycle response regulator